MLMSVILAAGKGTRMVSDLPKVLHPVLGMSLLEHMVEKVDALSCSPRVAVVGYGRELIEERFGDAGLTFAFQEEQLGTGHAASVGVEAGLGASEAAGAEHVLVLNGDLPLLDTATLERMWSVHRERAADVTILTCEQTDPHGYGRIVRGGDGRFSAIVEEKDADEATRAIRETNVGVYIFSLESFKTFYARTDRNNAQGEYYITDVVGEAASDGRVIELVATASEDEIAQVNSRREQAEVNALLRERLLGELMDAGVTLVDPDTVYVEMGVKVGRDTTILPCTYLSRGVEIGSGCQIGPFVHMRPGTVVRDHCKVGNFVEIKGSTLGNGTKVSHLTYVGDAELGEKVNVGAGTVFANYDGARKHKTVVRDRAFIGSGTILVAPVSVGESAVTGAGAVITSKNDVPDGTTVVGVPARPIRKKEKRAT